MVATSLSRCLHWVAGKVNELDHAINTILSDNSNWPIKPLLKCFCALFLAYFAMAQMAYALVKTLDDLEQIHSNFDMPESNISAAMETLYRGGDEFNFINFYVP